MSQEAMDAFAKRLEEEIRRRMETDPELASLLNNAIPELDFEGHRISVAGRIDRVNAWRVAQEMLERSSYILRTRGCVLPVGFVMATRTLKTPGSNLPEDEAMLLILTPKTGTFQDDVGSKDSYARALRKLAWKTNAVATLYLCECWTVNRSTKEEVLNARPVDAPDRSEIVYASFEHTDGTRISGRAAIQRDEEGSPTAPHWDLIRSTKYQLPQVSGRFGTLLMSSAVHLV